MSKNLKNIGTVATATVFSRVLGLVREMFIAAAFGTSALNSAFTSAFTLPNLFRRLLGEGALTAAFVPTLAHELEHRQRVAAFALVSKVASWIAVVTTLLVAVGMAICINSGALLRLGGGFGLGPDATDRLELGGYLAVVLFPYLVFVCLAAVFSAACQVLGRYGEPAMSPVWLNLTIISALAGGAWWAWDDVARMNLLCVSVLVGGFLQMAVPAGVLWQEGWRPRFDLRSDDRLREIIRLMGPTLIGSAIYFINISVSRFIGLSLNDHAASVLNLATRVMELPIGVFTVAIATVIFPLFARHAAKGDWASLTDDYHKGLRLVQIINVPAAVGLALLSEPITRLLFERRAFTAADTALMTPILAIYALGLPVLSFTTVALRGFYALKDTATPVWAAALSFVFNVLLSLVLMQSMSTAGLALASTLAVGVQAWFLQSRLSRKLPGFHFAPQLPNLGKIALASAGMGGLVFGGLKLIGVLGLAPKVHDLVVIGGLIPLAVALYAAMLWLMKIEGREEVAQMFAKLRGKTVAKT
ncbi:MAG TPA: murein biosynthesis integral membrane protein MurJ [Lacunisphaera sp.]|nr:murein biosynthesis integral membrane protein MurJ [Lacunisphaera sp.]